MLSLHAIILHLLHLFCTKMMLLRPILSILAVASFTSAWNCDKRCPDYEECVQEEKDRGNRRVLVDGGKTIPHQHDGTNIQSLRGGEQHNREMGVSSVTRFQLRMYHEESTEYCWQSEWEDRGWCMECEECEEDDGCSGNCDRGDSLWIQFCNDDESAQYFVYEPVSGTGGGRIKPYDDQSLCLEKASGAKDMTLESCQDGNTAQILIGFDMKNPFELYPYGLDPHSTTSVRCLTQAHHPKRYEIIKAYSCRYARGDKTSFFVAYDATYGNGNPLGVTPDATEAPSDAVPEPTETPVVDPTVSPSSSPYPQLNDRGDCSPTNPCGHCEGDCDSDSDCSGDLECYHRTRLEAVPSCSGGGTIDNRRDFCVPPEENNRPQVVDDGASACLSGNPCDHCHGDCDNDSQCNGTLECYKRQYGEAVPSCRGGESILNSRDFCVPPEYN